MTKNIHHKFRFQNTRDKCNYLCSHLQVWLGEANRIVTLFFYFSHICASGSCAPLSTLPSPSDLIWWLTFQVINLDNFSGIRSMKFQRSGWFKCRTNGILLIWSLRFQNTLHLSSLSMNWVELHFLPLGHISNGFQGKKPEKITFEKLFFSTWKLTLFGES